MKQGVHRFKSDLIWNMGFFGLSAISGLILNFVIIKQAGEESLGVFNQVFAVYLFLSQLAVGGVHLSVQRYIPMLAKRNDHYSAVLIPALMQTMLISFVVVLIASLLNRIPGFLLNSSGVSDAMILAVPGLFFLSINKVLLSFLNGIRAMKLFGFYTFLRPFFLLILVSMHLSFQFDPGLLAVHLSISEFLLMIPIALYCRSFLIPQQRGFKFNRWWSKHRAFGKKALTANILLDVNTRVDVFVIGFYLDDAQVGIYTFAAMFAEGFYQLPVLLRNNINPILSSLHARYDLSLTQRIMKRFMRFSFRSLLALSVLAAVIFPLILWMAGMLNHVFMMSGIFAILVLGCGLTGAYQPLILAFNQMGNPSLQTRLILALALFNALFCLILVPALGITGAALGTALSMFVQMFYQKYLFKKVFHWTWL